MSVAIFGSAWTYEFFGPRTFRELETVFWAQLFPSLYIHVPIYEDETFQTSFCSGYGRSLYHSGEVNLNMIVKNEIKQVYFYKTRSKTLFFHVAKTTK